MEVGLVLPQGWTGEFAGWEPERAWSRLLAVAQRAEELGFGSLWLFDHFHTDPEPTDEPTFEAFTALAAVAALTRRARLGHLVLCAGYRNPALVAKMTGTLDVISGGRLELGLGAGWKRDEWLAYGYGFPSATERLAQLRDSLEVATRMLAPGRATWEGTRARVDGAVNLPRGLQQPRVPIVVGGNGPNVTWRLAARFADELNLDGPSPDEVASWLPVIRSRCEEAGRDPDDLRISVHLWWGNAPPPGPERAGWLQAYREMGVSRVMALLPDSAGSDAPVEQLAADAGASGATLEPG